MPQTLPFSALLDVLRARGLEIGLIEYRDLAVLLSRYGGHSREELRNAIAALVARDPVERQMISACYDELFPGDQLGPPVCSAAPQRPTSTSTKPRTIWTPRRKVVAAIVAIVLTVLVVPAVLPIINPIVPDPPLIDEAPPPRSGSDTEQRPPAPQPPPAPRKTHWTSLLLPATVSFGTLLILATAYRTSRSRANWRRAVRRAALTSIAGPRFYRWPVDHRAMAMPRHVVEEMASILGRRHQLARTSNHLDVRMTVRRTLEAGLFPRIVFEPPCRMLPVLVLHDVGPEMRPWRSRIELLLRDLERLGIPIRRFYFDASARTLWRSDTELPTTLDELSRSEDDAALLVISTGAGVRAALADGADSWLRVVEKWSSRAWVTPLTSRWHWRPELALVPMSVWPMTPGGLNAAARDLLLDATHRPSARPQALAGARAVGADDLERIKRLVAVVPQPAPVEVVDALRARFTPDIPGDALLPLLAQNDVLDSAHVTLPDREVRRLLAALRRDNPDREIAVRRFLLDLLDSTEPPPDTAAHLRWQTDVALQRAQIVELAGGNPEESINKLYVLAAGPLGEEVTARARGVAATGRLRDPLEPLTRAISAESGPVRADAPSRPHIARPRVLDLALTCAATAAAIGVFIMAGGLESQTIAHLSKAFTLEWDPKEDSLKMTIADATPQTQAAVPVLTRNGEAVQTVVWRGSRDGSYSPPQEQRGAWFQVRAELSEGNLALSNSVWVPAAAKLLPRQTGSFRGYIQNPDNSPVPNAKLMLRNVDTGLQVATTMSSASGEFGFSRVDSGTYVIDVLDKDGYPLATSQPFTPAIGETRDTIVRLLANIGPTVMTLAFRFTNVYGDDAADLSGELTVLDKSGTVAARERVAGATASTRLSSPGPYRVSIESSNYESTSFSVAARATASVPVDRTLLIRPTAVPTLRSVPQRFKDLRIPDGKPEAIINALNIMQRAEATVVELERPLGTWSRPLSTIIREIVQISEQRIDVLIDSSAAPYVATWIEQLVRRATPGKKKDESANDSENDSEPLEDPQAAQSLPRTGSPDRRVSLPSGRTTLDLQFESGGLAAQTLRMSLRRSSAGDSHPYTIHQLLIQDRFAALFRLRAEAPPAAR